MDNWVAGEAYERYVGRWSRVVAREFLSWLEVAGRREWLDVGSGTGGLSETILELASPLRVKGIDSSAGFIACARKRIQDARAYFEIASAQAVPDEPESYDSVVAGLVLNFIPEPGQAVREMTRVTKLGGTVGAYVWDYAGKMQLMRHFWDAAAALDPRAVELDEGRRFPICHPKPLAELFRTAGLADVETRAIDIATDFTDFEDYWSPFLGGQGPAPSYAMSLSEGMRVALRERIRAGLPAALDGSVRLVARAWAVRGVRPRLPHFN